MTRRWQNWRRQAICKRRNVRCPAPIMPAARPSVNQDALEQLTKTRFLRAEKLYQDGYLNQAKAAYEGLPEGYSQDGISAAERLEVLDRYQGFMKLCGQWHSSGTGNRIETRETYSSGRYYYWYQEPGAYSGSVSITCQIQEDGKVKISGTAEFRRYTNYDDNANRLKTDTKTISFSETSASIPYTIKQGGMTLTWNGNGFSLYYQLKDKSKSYATYTYTCQYRFDNRSSAY